MARPRSQRADRTPGSSRRAPVGHRPGLNPVALGIAIGLPVLAVLFGIIYMASMQSNPKVIVEDEKQDYDQAKRLIAEAQNIYMREFLGAPTDRQPIIREKAEEKLAAAQAILNDIYRHYSSDGTLDGDLPEDYMYIDDALGKLGHLRYNFLKAGAVDTAGH